MTAKKTIQKKPAFDVAAARLGADKVILVLTSCIIVGVTAFFTTAPFPVAHWIIVGITALLILFDLRMIVYRIHPVPPSPVVIEDSEYEGTSVLGPDDPASIWYQVRYGIDDHI